MIVKVLIFLVTLIIFIIIVPLKIEINYKTEDESSINIIDKIIKNEKKNNYLRIYLLGFLPLPKIKIKTNKNVKLLEKQGVIKNLINTIFSLLMEFIGTQKIDNALLNKKELKRLINSIYFKKIAFSLGYNLQNITINAYFMAILNAVLSLLFASNYKKFNTQGINYDTYISNKIYDFKIYCILKFKMVNNIGIFIKIFIKLRKVAKEYGKGSTSNRRFNDDRYDIA